MKRNHLIYFVPLGCIKTGEVYNSFFLINVNVRGMYLMQRHLSATLILQNFYDSFDGVPCKHVSSNLLPLHGVRVTARSSQGKRKLRLSEITQLQAPKRPCNVQVTSLLKNLFPLERREIFTCRRQPNDDCHPFLASSVA
jgi:hypothetical protein